jgi:hypothetical protein
MNCKGKTYKTKSIAAALVMALSLLWLTVSLPFMYDAQVRQGAYARAFNDTNKNDGSEDSSANPFANSTEEKTPSSINLSEEYLHHYEEQIQFADNKLKHTHTHFYEVYVAFHGDLLSPPPET